jgi:protoheme IX farnesyltransferase
MVAINHRVRSMSRRPETGLARLRLIYYLEVLKPMPSLLLAFIGVSTAVIASEGRLSLKLLLVLVTVLIAAAGANGLTNYLDRGIDACLQRNRHRALPSKNIYPAEKVLPLVGSLIIVGLVLAWQLGIFVFLADLVGTTVAATWRKKVTCVYPQGVIASCAPLLMGWLAVQPALNWELLLLCVLIVFWLPLHVWSVNIAYRDDYLQAGLHYFPLNLEVRDAVKVLSAFSLALYGVSIALYFVGDFGWLYLALANILGIIMVSASLRLAISGVAGDAWRLYKVSTFPYLGLVFLAMCLNTWLRW